MIIALIGAHGAGKSTLGRALAATLGVPFDHEIGDALGRDPAWRPPDGTAVEPQAAFDAEVFRRECARDAARGRSPRVVESWHPGNLAYARRRSPAVAAAALRAVRTTLGDVGPVIVVPVFAPAEVLRARQHEPGDPAFFAAVGREALGCARELGLRCLPAVDTSLDTPAGLARHLAVRIPSLRASA